MKQHGGSIRATPVPKVDLRRKTWENSSKTRDMGIILDFYPMDDDGTIERSIYHSWTKISN